MNDGFRMSRMNAEVWFGGELAEEFWHLALRPAESNLLVRQRDALSGRVFELGCGSGRLTVHLAEQAAELVAVDGSPAMVERARQRVPSADISWADFQDLSRFQAGGFDAIVAGFNMFDVFDDAERRRALAEMRRLLAPDGRLLFSAHNRGFRPFFGNPWHLLLGRPEQPVRSLVRLPRRWSNRRRLRRRERFEPGYAIVNDPAHDFGLLHYNISRDAQQQQLAECDFELLDCRDLEDRVVPAGEDAPRCPELHYVARPTPG